MMAVELAACLARLQEISMLFVLTSPLLPAPVRLNLRAECTTVALGMNDVLWFDGIGRLITAYRDGRMYKRGLDHRVMVKWRPWTIGRPEYLRRDLPTDEKRRLLDDVRATIQQVLAILPADAPAEAQCRLEQILLWDTEAYTADGQQFNAAYKPVPIVPPDQYMALILQPTEGCHYNRCTFCHFYRGRPFHIKNEAEFRAHITAVQRFFGPGASLRRTIFLADANALVIPMPRLLPIFAAITDMFEVAAAELRGAALAHWKASHPQGITGIYSFIDAFTGKQKTGDAFAELAERGLRRVYIGMESGHVPLLEWLRKPSMPADVRAVVQAAKAANVHVGVIVMLGIGGERYASGHIADTIDVVNTLGLDTGDILYFSEFVDESGSEYAARAQEASIRPLTGAEVRAQVSAIRAGLRFERAPKIAAYDIREFLY
jgi:hypothetical protein